MRKTDAKDRPRGLAGVFGRRHAGRNLLILGAGCTVALSVGVGIASAQDESPRTAALSSASAISTGFPSAKASLYQQGVAAAFPTNPAPKPTAAQPAPAPGVPTFDVPNTEQTGISRARQAPFGNEDFAVQNSYSTTVNGLWYVAYAGTVGGDSASTGEGGVRVLDAAAAGDSTDLGAFPAPGTTSLRVTAYSGDLVTLTANTGATFTFNLGTLSYQ